jgi:hypothetical protein
MASAIDATKPTAQLAFTADMRANFQAAKDEIEELQAAIASALDRVATLEQRLAALDHVDT